MLDDELDAQSYDTEWEDEDTEKQPEQNPAVERMQRQIMGKLESGVMPKWMAAIVRERFNECEREENPSRKRELLEDLERRCLDTVDWDIDIARDYLDDSAKGEDAPDGESALDTYRKEARELQRWYYGEQERIDAMHRLGQINDSECEKLYRELRRRYSKKCTQIEQSAVGLPSGSLSDLDWESRHLLLAGTHPELYRKAQEYREMIKEVPWQKRGELEEELRRNLDIDDDTYRELRDAILD